MFTYIDTPMDKFSDRPDRTIPHTHSGEKSGDPCLHELVLNPAHSPDFGKADRKDRA